MKNKRIRKAMTDASISQVELAVREQNEIVKRIREWDAQKKGEERRQHVNAV